MFKSLADVFNSPEARFNDPLHEIHNPVIESSMRPYDNEYDDLYNNLNPKIYPKPKNKSIHNTINPMHGALKPVKIIK